MSIHLIDLGNVAGSPIVVDGTPPAPFSARPGSMQLVNHACRADDPGGLKGPNCVARHVQTDDGLGLWVLQTSRSVRIGEPISFDYGGSFWSVGQPTAPVPGRQLVRCKCAGSACPKGRWRWERSSRSRALPAHRDTVSSLQPQSLRGWLATGVTALDHGSDGGAVDLGSSQDVEIQSSSDAGGRADALRHTVESTSPPATLRGVGSPPALEPASQVKAGLGRLARRLWQG